MPDLLATLTTALADRYRIERELGEGGMATVYLAEDLKHHRRVAIKVLKPALAAALGVDRFMREIATTAALQHPHILPLFDSGHIIIPSLHGGAEGEVLFYVMPFVDGNTLRDELDHKTQLGVEEAIRITRELADALDYAHRHGVVHRDIKPENILLSEGRTLLADFGIALSTDSSERTRLTETGVSIGTPGYMSPEQALGERAIDARSDIYAVGAVFYEMLTGTAPFTGPSAQAIVANILMEKPVPPSRRRKGVPASIDRVVLTTLAKDPAERFPTAAALGAALADTNTAPRRKAIAKPALLATGLFVVGLLSVVLLLRPAQVRAPVQPRAAPDTAAQRLVKLAEYWALKRTEAGCELAIPAYARAATIDANYLEAWEGLAHTSAICALFGTGDPNAGFANAAGAAEKALALDSASATGWMVRGMTNLFSYQDWSAAARDFNRAIALDSSDFAPWLYRTWVFYATGQLDSARASIQRASQLAPTDNTVGARLAGVLDNVGDTAGARRAVSEVLQRDSTDIQGHRALMQLAVNHGACPEGLQEVRWFQRHHALEPGTASSSYRANAGIVAQVWAECGFRNAARRYADSTRAAGRAGGYIDAFALARVYARLRDTTAMFQALDQAVDQHNWSLYALRGDLYLWNRCRSDPRYRTLLHRLHED